LILLSPTTAEISNTDDHNLHGPHFGVQPVSGNSAVYLDPKTSQMCPWNLSNKHI